MFSVEKSGNRRNLNQTIYKAQIFQFNTVLFQCSHRRKREPNLANTCSSSEYIFSYFVEFLPYVFQVLSLLLELRKDTLPESYMGLFPFLLSAAPWERQGNKYESNNTQTRNVSLACFVCFCARQKIQVSLYGNWQVGQMVKLRSQEM